VFDERCGCNTIIFHLLRWLVVTNGDSPFCDPDRAKVIAWCMSNAEEEGGHQNVLQELYLLKAGLEHQQVD
jgi:hypothetical protein